MKPKPQWVKVSADLYLSAEGRYACARRLESWVAVWWDGAGWSELFPTRPAESLLEAKARVSRHRWTRPLAQMSP